jgi:hypothetical protein
VSPSNGRGTFGTQTVRRAPAEKSHRIHAIDALPSFDSRGRDLAREVCTMTRERLGSAQACYSIAQAVLLDRRAAMNDTPQPIRIAG